MDKRTREAVRYLGYGKHAIDERVLEMIQECFTELEQVSNAKFIYRIFEVSKMNEEELAIGYIKIKSRNLSKNLDGCHGAVVLGITLGTNVDLLMKKYSVTNVTKAAILQACATALLEEYCDEIIKKISLDLKNNEYIRVRFSPGYGDFSILHQKDLLQVLDAPKKIGLTMTDGYMLTPTKSITAIMGISHDNTSCHIDGCEMCPKKDCAYKRSE